MALREDIGRRARSLALPAAASVAGAGAGLVLTRKSVRDAMPDLGENRLGDLAGDLKAKLDSVVGKAGSSSNDRSRSGTKRIDPDELNERLRNREQRRSKRRARS